MPYPNKNAMSSRRSRRQRFAVVWPREKNKKNKNSLSFRKAMDQK